MDFGKIDISELDKVNYDLPADEPATKKLLNRGGKDKTKIYIGCAKWGRKDWIGKIYPKGSKESDFLELYAKHFNCIELNATFYKMPDEESVLKWKSKVGPGFKFCPKFTDSITHKKRLKDATELTTLFLRGIQAFDENLGPAFIQLPPNFGPKNKEVLIAYLKALPKDVPAFVELRHPDWFKSPNFEEIFDAIEDIGLGSIITDAAGRRDCVHTRLTNPKAFIRFVGNSLHPTDFQRIDAWTEKLGGWINHGLQELYFFMHQHDELYSPELIKYQILKMNDILKLDIPVPNYDIKNSQLGFLEDKL